MTEAVRIAEKQDLVLEHPVWCDHSECETPRAGEVTLLVSEGGRMLFFHSDHLIEACPPGEEE